MGAVNRPFSNKFNESSAESYNRGKLPHGRSLCQVVQFRETDGHNGYTFHIDLVATGEGVAKAGTETTISWQPAKKKEFVQKDEGKLKRNCGACFDLSPAASTAEMSLERITDELDRGEVAGNLVWVDSSPSEKVNEETGQPWTNQHAAPYRGLGQPEKRPLPEKFATVGARQAFGSSQGSSSSPASGTVAVPNVPPPPPVAPVSKPFPPQGWAAHPQAPGWFYNTLNPQEQLQEAQLRAR